MNTTTKDNSSHKHRLFIGVKNYSKGLGVALIRVFTVQRTGLPQVQVQGQLLQVQLPAIRSSVCPMGIYQDSKTGSSSTQRVGSENDRLYQQHSDLSRDTHTPEGPHNGSDLPIGELGVYYWLLEMCVRADAVNKVSGLHGRLSETGAPSTSGENEKNQGSGPKAECFHGNSKKTIPVLGKTECGNTSSTSGPTILLRSPSCPGRSLSSRSSGLFHVLGSHTKHEGRTAVVGEPPLTMEQQDSGNSETLCGHRNRCIKTGLGGNLPGDPDRRILVETRIQHAHQLPRSTGSVPSNQVICSGPQKCDSPAQNGQHLREQA